MGSGKTEGSRCIYQDEVPVVVPGGRKCELKVVPGEGRSRGAEAFFYHGRLRGGESWSGLFVFVELEGEVYGGSPSTTTS